VTAATGSHANSLMPPSPTSQRNRALVSRPMKPIIKHRLIRLASSP
jgi:hypothetical protein